MTRRRPVVPCPRCGTPVRTRIEGFMDGVPQYCVSCDPTRGVLRPRVTLYGAPDGQEMGKWVDARSTLSD